MSDITIAVTDPTKNTDKFGQVYISYSVTSSTNRAGYAPGEKTVIRRYNDFSWLSATISQQIPGIIVPPLPEKQAVGRFSQNFVDSRRRTLEKFLQRTANHPEIAPLEQFIIFLQADDAAMSKAKNEVKAAKPGVMDWFSGSVSTAINGKGEIEKTGADVKIEEITQYVAALEKQMANVTKHADGLVKRCRDMSAAMKDFGQSTTWLGQSEGDAVGGMLTQLGTNMDTLANSNTEHAEQECIKLLEPLEESARMLKSIKMAIQGRQDKKTAYMNATGEVESKTNAYKKVLGVPGKETQTASKEAAVNAAAESCATAKIEFEKVSERLLVEFESFKNQKALDMKEIVLGFVALQIDFHQASDSAWSQLLPKIDEVTIAKVVPGRPYAAAPFRPPAEEDSNPYGSVSNDNNDKNAGSGFQEQPDDEEDLVGV